MYVIQIFVRHKHCFTFMCSRHRISTGLFCLSSRRFFYAHMSTERINGSWGHTEIPDFSESEAAFKTLQGYQVVAIHIQVESFLHSVHSLLSAVTVALLWVLENQKMEDTENTDKEGLLSPFYGTVSARQ